MTTPIAAQSAKEGQISNFIPSKPVQASDPHRVIWRH
jgi:hypothetical protein